MNYRIFIMFCIIVNKYDKFWLVGIVGVVFNCNDWSIIDDFVYIVIVNFVFFCDFIFLMDKNEKNMWVLE